MLKSSVVWMDRRSAVMLFCALLVCGGLGGCDLAESPTQPDAAGRSEMSILIPLSKPAAANISRAEVVVTSADMTTITASLSVSGNALTGFVRDIPAGNNRTFTINGYSSSGDLTYTGSATASVSAGQRVRVEIIVRPASASAPSLSVVGTPRVTRGVLYGDSDWSEYGNLGEDARVTGEILNSGTEIARGVSITVDLRNSGGSLLGRITGRVIGDIPANSSVFFSVFVTSVFSYAGDENLSAMRATITFE